MSDLKHQELPLARIKKIMKLDDDVKVMYIASRSVNFSVDFANFDRINYHTKLGKCLCRVGSSTVPVCYFVDI
jgi:hypothetical protein